MKALLGLQVFICGDKGAESSFFYQSQKLPIFHGGPALPWDGRHLVTGQVITNLFRDAFIEQNALQD